MIVTRAFSYLIDERLPALQRWATSEGLADAVLSGGKLFLPNTQTALDDAEILDRLAAAPAEDSTPVALLLCNFLCPDIHSSIQKLVTKLCGVTLENVPFVEKSGQGIGAACRLSMCKGKQTSTNDLKVVVDNDNIGVIFSFGNSDLRALLFENLRRISECPMP